MSFRIDLLESQIRDVKNVMRDEESKSILDRALNEIHAIHDIEHRAWEVSWVKVSEIRKLHGKPSKPASRPEIRIEMADSSRMDFMEENHGDLVREFMRDILGHEDALVTDESEIRDFCMLEESWDDFQKKAVEHGLVSAGRYDRVVDVIAEWVTLHRGSDNIIQFTPK